MAKDVVPPLSALKAKYPHPDRYSRKAIYDEIGLTMPEGPQWENTCALRMSYCLLRCDIKLGKETGRGTETLIRQGPHKDKHIWLSRKNLAKRVKEIFGAPTISVVSANKDFEVLKEKIGKGGGIISFGKLAADERDSEYAGGHIDVGYYTTWLYFWDDLEMMMGHNFRRLFGRAEQVEFWKSPA
ncbi:MAG: hypothetical protein IPK82_10435 [Polyangiaceae bacterium]|nr:hypothetical protein [Polyangiaceae bacterium]